MADRSSIKAFLGALPPDLRMRVRLAYIDGVANTVCALLPWLLPPTLVAIMLLIARLFGWESETEILTCFCCFMLGIPTAFFIVRAVEVSVLCSRMRVLAPERLPMCPQCLYDQQGTTTDVCPECGHTTRFVPVSAVTVERVPQ